MTSFDQAPDEFGEAAPPVTGKPAIDHEIRAFFDRVLHAPLPARMQAATLRVSHALADG